MNAVVCDSTGLQRPVGTGWAGLESTAGPSPVGSPALLQARGLTKRFAERAALVDVSLDLWPGEVLAVVGESGSGKTTLLQLLAARLQPDAGSVLFQDREGQMHEVTHDLAVARLLAERMIVMRSGRIVEAGLTDQLLEDPRHPYTQLLVSSMLPT